MSKKFLISVLSVMLIMLSVVTPTFAETASSSSSFSDIEKSYAKDAINELLEKGIITGVDDKGHFNPKGALTRAQFVTIMVKALGLEVDMNATSSFSDVSGWAVPYVEAAYKAGIITGTGNGKFSPNATVTREMSATILVKSLQTQGKLDDTDAQLTFKDADKISDWAKPYIALAQKYGLIKGNPDGTFNPKGKANREQAAVMGSNLLTSIKVVKEAQPPEASPAPTETPAPTTPPIGGGGGGGGGDNGGGGGDNGGGGNTNNAPTVVNPIADIVVGAVAISVDASNTFTDKDGHTLNLSAISSETKFATVNVSGKIITIDRVSMGTSTIKVTANDGHGGTVTDSFDVIVQEVASKLEDGTAVFGNGTTVKGLPTEVEIAGNPTTVTVPNIETAGQAMNFTLSGAVPKAGVILSLPIDDDSVDAGLSYFNEVRGKWELQEGSTISEDKNFVIATVHHFSIYGAVEKSAKLIADTITEIVAPAKDATILTLPKVDADYTVAIFKTSNDKVIDIDGKITPPEVATTVALELKVTNLDNKETALTASLDVAVPAKTVVEPKSPTISIKQPEWTGESDNASEINPFMTSLWKDGSVFSFADDTQTLTVDMSKVTEDMYTNIHTWWDIQDKGSVPVAVALNPEMEIVDEDGDIVATDPNWNNAHLIWIGLKDQNKNGVVERVIEFENGTNQKINIEVKGLNAPNISIEKPVWNGASPNASEVNPFMDSLWADGSVFSFTNDTLTIDISKVTQEVYDKTHAWWDVKNNGSVPVKVALTPDTVIIDEKGNTVAKDTNWSDAQLIWIGLKDQDKNGTVKRTIYFGNGTSKEINIVVTGHTAPNVLVEQPVWTGTSDNASEVNAFMDSLWTDGVFAFTGDTLTIDMSKVNQEVYNKTLNWWGSTNGSVPMALALDPEMVITAGTDGSNENWNAGGSDLIWIGLKDQVKNGTVEKVIEFANGTSKKMNIAVTGYTAPTVTFSNAESTSGLDNQDKLNVFLTALWGQNEGSTNGELGFEVNKVFSVSEDGSTLTFDSDKATNQMKEFVNTNYAVDGSPVPVKVTFSDASIPTLIDADANWDNAYLIWVDLANIEAGTKTFKIAMSNGTNALYSINTIATPPVVPVPINTINHVATDASTPVFSDTNGYFLQMEFEVSRDLNLADLEAQFSSYYEYEYPTVEGTKIAEVENFAGEVFTRTKEWGFVRYMSEGGVLQDQPKTLVSGTKYLFVTSGDTIDRLNSLYLIKPETPYKVRVVYVITDEDGNSTTSRSPWVDFVR